MLVCTSAKYGGGSKSSFSRSRKMLAQALWRFSQCRRFFSGGPKWSSSGIAGPLWLSAPTAHRRQHGDLAGERQGQRILGELVVDRDRAALQQSRQRRDVRRQPPAQVGDGGAVGYLHAHRVRARQVLRAGEQADV